MKNKKNNLPNVWNKATTNDIPDGALWFNPDDPGKLKARIDGEWKELDPFKDLEERKVKKQRTNN